MRVTQLAGFIITVFIFVCVSECICVAEGMVSSDEALCEYGIRLYKQGDINDAIRQLRLALMVNPYNLVARDYLIKILIEQRLIEQRFPEGRPPIQDTKGKINQLNDEVVRLQEENRSYQKQLNARKDTSAGQDNELLKLVQQLKSEKERYQVELSQKEKESEKLKSDYENRLKAMDEEIKTKESKIKTLTDNKESVSERKRRIEMQEIAAIEKIMKSIAEVLPKKKGKKTKGSY